MIQLWTTGLIGEEENIRSSKYEDSLLLCSDTRPTNADRTYVHIIWNWSQVYIVARNEGAVQQGPVRPRVLNDLSAEERKPTRGTANENRTMMERFLHQLMIFGTSVEMPLFSISNKSTKVLLNPRMNPFFLRTTFNFDSEVLQLTAKTLESLPTHLPPHSIIQITSSSNKTINFGTYLMQGTKLWFKTAEFCGTRDTREIAEITRKRMMEKMKSPLCVENKVRIAPLDYSKENLLATFAPQRNLTPRIDQIGPYEENDRKRRLNQSVPKPLLALTVYPPNTPVKLVPRVLPTKSQVKINLYVLTQLFTEFDKTCKKRITPTGVQTALYKEVKVMEEIFDQMNDAVDQNTVRHSNVLEIERKNLLLANENSNC
ncbi:hypothetical protein Tco_0727446 [Tanacetum coccineum]|uniref:Uncharacterized protein n=1 Tax=Tanacetum coccineum TaxID=301880 RepID=A0ABQ4YIZ8_9ASTR